MLASMSFRLFLFLSLVALGLIFFSSLHWIKGNGGSMIYHLPSCPNYAIVDMHDDINDTWFINEKQAQNAGFRKANNCPL